MGGESALRNKLDSCRIWTRRLGLHGSFAFGDSGGGSVLTIKQTHASNKSQELLSLLAKLTTLLTRVSWPLATSVMRCSLVRNEWEKNKSRQNGCGHWGWTDSSSLQDLCVSGIFPVRLAMLSKVVDDVF